MQPPYYSHSDWLTFYKIILNKKVEGSNQLERAVKSFLTLLYQVRTMKSNSLPFLSGLGADDRNLDKSKVEVVSFLLSKHWVLFRCRQHDLVFNISLYMLQGKIREVI